MPAPKARRAVWFAGESYDTPVYWRDDLPGGAAFTGPAIIEQLDSTTVVPPGAKAEVDPRLNILIHVEKQA
jgi:N-methylhydantoinase A